MLGDFLLFFNLPRDQVWDRTDCEYCSKLVECQMVQRNATQREQFQYQFQFQLAVSVCYD